MLTSINVAPIGFQSSIDSTRLNMACRQISQSLPDINTQVPFVLSDNYRQLVDNSYLGICKAKDDGKIIYNNDGVLIIYYKNLQKVETKYVPKTAKTSGTYASTLRHSLPQYAQFSKGDILYEYSEFTNGIPTYGYNVFTGFIPFFGYNHEDSIVMSEDLANRSCANFIDKVYVPITEYTLLQHMYDLNNTGGGFFPGVGEKLIDNIVCCSLDPKTSTTLHVSNPKNIRDKMIRILKSMNLSDMINMTSQSVSNFILNKHVCKLDTGYITGIKVHKLKKEVNMIDSNLQNVLESMWVQYAGYIKEVHDHLHPLVGKDYTLETIKKHYMYSDGETTRHKVNLKAAVYLLEFEIGDRHHSERGDKFANTCANKGVISNIIPNELRPVTVSTGTPIDLIFNPFGVFSRMNLAQLLEGCVGKTVMYCDNAIKQNPSVDNVYNTVGWLNENIIKHFNTPDYYNDVSKLVERVQTDSDYASKFIDDIVNHNLFIEAPAFKEVNVDRILQNGVNPNEPILIKKETIKYFRQKLGVDVPFPDQDCVVNDVFCGPLYIMKLYKLTSHIANARDFGPVRSVTKQPLKGRARSGGSRIGQMELEAILAHGCEKSIKEIMTVKSDWADGKRDLLKQLIETGSYVLPEDNEISSQTKKVVDVQIDFLRK